MHLLNWENYRGGKWYQSYQGTGDFIPAILEIALTMQAEEEVSGSMAQPAICHGSSLVVSSLAQPAIDRPRLTEFLNCLRGRQGRNMSCQKRKLRVVHQKLPKRGWELRWRMEATILFTFGGTRAP